MENRNPTRKDLYPYNGKGSVPEFTAHEGKVYAVGQSFLWMHDKQWALHSAGTDLTGAIDQTPNDTSLFWKFPAVGDLVQD
jgi:predicted heme/steroid binding protein